MFSKSVHKLLKLPSRIRITLRRAVYNKFNDHIIFIHTPKCAGTYLHKQYKIHRQLHISPIGHALFPVKTISSRASIVGLIREPGDWYASYYYFCKKALSNAPQSISNFPVQHPISIFSRSAELSLTQMLANMADKDFLDKVCANGVIANVYKRNLDDVFDFIRRTNSGFWSWTMMYHFSKRQTSELKTREGVIREARKIVNYVDFIHQENIDEAHIHHIGPQDCLSESM